MFAKTIIDSDAFLDMPMSAQALYFHLSMRADDDGFVNNPKRIQKMIGASGDDLKLLIAKSFIITFDNGVVVIKHWKIHNYIQNDRYKPTNYLEEKAMLSVKENKEYTLDTECIQDGYNLDTQVRLDKDSIVKDSLGKDNIGECKPRKFKPPTLDEVKEYCFERNNNVDAETFIDFYTSKDWYVGKNKMKDWKAAVRTWEKNSHGNKQTKKAQELDSFYNMAAQWAESEGY